MNFSIHVKRFLLLGMLLLAIRETVKASIVSKEEKKQMLEIKINGWRLSACKISSYFPSDEELLSIRTWCSKHRAAALWQCSCVPMEKYTQRGAAERIPAVTDFSSQGNSLCTSKLMKNFNKSSPAPLPITALGIITSHTHKFICTKRTRISFIRKNYQ